MSTRRALVSAVALLALAGCGGSDAPDVTAAPAGETAPAAEESEAPEGAEESVDVPAAYPCDALSVDEVGAFLDDTYTVEVGPFDACEYSPEDPRGSADLSVAITELFEGAGGFEGSRSGSEAAAGGTATDLDGVGQQAYVVEGMVGGLTIAVAQAQLSETALLTVTVTGGDRGAADAESLLRTAFAKL